VYQLDFSEDDGPVIFTACNKCRTVVFWDDAVSATRAIVHHAERCGSDSVVIVEVLKGSQ